MDASKSPSKGSDAQVSARLGLFVAPSLQDEPPAVGSEKADYRTIVSRRVEQGAGGLMRRLAFEEAAEAPTEYIVDAFSLRGRRRGPVGSGRG